MSVPFYCIVCVCLEHMHIMWSDMFQSIQSITFSVAWVITDPAKLKKSDALKPKFRGFCVIAKIFL